MSHTEGYSILVFPREYSTDPSNPYVDGVDASNNPIRVHFPNNQKMDEARARYSVDHVPSIAKFADTREGAALRCIATPDNGPDNPHGELLFQQCFFEHADNGQPKYIAGWGSVLAESADSIRPEFGIGYMEVDEQLNRLPKDKRTFVEDHKKVYQAALRKIAHASTTPEERENLQVAANEAIAKVNKEISPKFRAVVLHPDRITTAPLSSLGSLRRDMISHIQKFTGQGRFGGVMLRVKDNDGAVKLDLSGEAFSSFSGKDEDVVKKAVDNYLYKGRGRAIKNVLDAGLTVDLIPTQRINCGPGGISTYSDPKQLQALRNTYFDSRTGTVTAYPISMRLATTTDHRSHLLARAYPVGDPYGHPLMIERNGEFSVPLSFQGVDLSPLDQTSNLVAAKDYSSDSAGLVSGEEYLVKDGNGNEFTAQCIEQGGENRLSVNGFVLPVETEYAPIAVAAEHVQENKLSMVPQPQ